MCRLLLFVFLLGGLSGFSQTATIDDAVDERVFLLKDLEFFIDSTNSITFSQVSDPAFTHEFQQRKSYQNKDYQSGASYWIRFSVKHNPTKKVWLLEFYDQTIDEIEAFMPKPDGTHDRWIMGDGYPFDQRKFAHKNFEVQLDNVPGTVQYYYFRVKSHEFADIRLAFRSVDRLIYYALNEYFLFGTFYGMILIIALYNFLVFLAIREIKNIYYIFYIISVALYAMSLDGVGFQYLWPAHPEWNNYTAGIFLYSLIFWALVFTRRFLSTRAKAPRLDKALKAMIVVRSGMFLFEFFLYPEFFAFRFIEILPLSLIFFTGIYVWSRGYRPARYFVIAYGLLLTGFFLRSLVFFNLIALTTISHYSLHFSFVVEMLFLTFALGDRITILKDNRDRALRRIIQQHELNMQLKDKVNKELEQKVNERTTELNSKNGLLEESNTKLLRQTHEINQINSVLDLDNWKLKNKIKVVLEERLMEKTMDYEEFKTLYPDTLACYRFLELLKWERGFHCRKCLNDKFFDGAQKFSRRCTRCGYNESITANTIFHNVKFPIEKAFFIAYLSVTGKKNYTLEVLSTMLDLRLNTVWSFKNKVQGQLSELELRGEKPSISKWQNVILTNEGRLIHRDRHKATSLRKF
ncbi:MAG: 7TM diverse intracellular signaling domain-containing protein [Cyclobacteriaceae bacterium]